MKHILIANSKGGSGKSTLAIALADVLDAQIVDLDHQGSLTTAASITQRHTPVSLHQASAPYLIYDTPPYLSEELPGFIKKADYILIPTRVGVYDLLALKGIVDMVRRANKTAQCLVVFNGLRKPPTKTFLKTKQFFASNYKDIPRAHTELSYLMAYHTLAERPIWGKAKKEIQNLLKEIV